MKFEIDLPQSEIQAAIQSVTADLVRAEVRKKLSHWGADRAIAQIVEHLWNHEVELLIKSALSEGNARELRERVAKIINAKLNQKIDRLLGHADKCRQGQLEI